MYKIFIHIIMKIETVRLHSKINPVDSCVEQEQIYLFVLSLHKRKLRKQENVSFRNLKYISLNNFST